LAVPVLSDFISRHQDLNAKRLLCRLPVSPQAYIQGARQLTTNPRPPPIRNQLLAALPRAEYKRLIPHLKTVQRWLSSLEAWIQSYGLR
jgi:hypothetical protein